MIFWKEGWLTQVDALNGAPSKPDSAGLAALTARLKATVSNGKYFCQSTNLTQATVPLTMIARFTKALRDVQLGTYTLPHVLKLIVKPLIGKILLRFQDRVPHTNRMKTPKSALGLVAGDLVEVKSAAEIAETLDVHGRNRGLVWSYDLAPYCGRRFRVVKRLDRIIVEYNAEMANMTDTVLLEGANCPCKYAVGGCPRSDLIYWREIWLKKIEEPANAHHSIKSGTRACATAETC